MYRCCFLLSLSSSVWFTATELKINSRDCPKKEEEEEDDDDDEMSSRHTISGVGLLLLAKIALPFTSVKTKIHPLFPRPGAPTSRIEDEVEEPAVVALETEMASNDRPNCALSLSQLCGANAAPSSFGQGVQCFRPMTPIIAL